MANINAKPKRLGNATTTTTVGIGGAVGVLTVFSLQHLGVSMEPSEAATVSAAIATITGYVFGGKKP